MAFYLKYRPTKITDLDLPEIREGLEKLVKEGKIPHTLLLSGPRGSGKTSAARILAKTVNCLNNKGKGAACGKCEICKGVVEGTFIDLIEIDGASNRGIDDVRSLREGIKLSPSRGRKKVYIIDEVHMLTTEAFNALLKTLEEPPAHALFVLCTTQLEKVPETIVSRCVRFNFRKAKPEEVERSLKKVVKGEKLKVGEGVLELIAKNVDGSFRDGQKLLEQLAATGKKITLKEAEELLGQVEALSPLKLIKILASGEVREGLLEIERLVKSGADLRTYTQKFLETVREVMLARLGVGDYREPKETKNLSLVDLQRLVRLFSEAGRELRTSFVPQLPLELAVIEWEQVGGSRKGEEEGESLVVAENPDNPGRGEENGGVELKRVEEYWPEILSKVRPMNHSVGALLKACRPLEVKGEILILEVFYPFHKERLETEKCRSIVEEATGGVLGMPMKIKCILGKKKPVLRTAPITEEEPSDILEEAEKIFNGKMVD